jgi:hypothetical protein
MEVCMAGSFRGDFDAVRLRGVSEEDKGRPSGSGDAGALTPWGLVDRTFTNALNAGGTLQAVTTTR